MNDLKQAIYELAVEMNSLADLLTDEQLVNDLKRLAAQLGALSQKE